MASSTSILLFLIITISTTQIHARDSQFFSKVTYTPTPTETGTVVLPNKEQEQQPDFIPQNQNGHGLYNKETEQETMHGVQTKTPGTYAVDRVYYNNDRNREDTETEQLNNGEKYHYASHDKNDDALLDFDQNDDAFSNSYNNNGVTTERYNGERYNHYSNRYQNDDAIYNNNQNGVGTEHYTDNNIGETETYYSNTNNNNDRFGTQLRGTDNGFTNELNTRYNNYRIGATGSNVVRQGMSDTRFMENGRYFYDVNNEEKMQNTYYNYNPKSKYNSEYRTDEVDRVNGHYYDNGNENRFYDNSGGEKYEFNTKDEYERSRQSQYDP